VHAAFMEIRKAISREGGKNCHAIQICRYETSGQRLDTGSAAGK